MGAGGLTLVWSAGNLSLSRPIWAQGLGGEELDLAAFGHRVLNLRRHGTGLSDPSCRVQGEERHRSWVHPPPNSRGVHTPNGRLACLLWMLPGAHLLRNEETAADADDFFADAGPPGCAGLVIHIQPRANQRRVADPAWQLVRQPRGRADSAEMSFLIQC